MPTYGHFIPNGHFPIRYSLYGHFIPYGHFPLWTLFHMDILPYGQFADSPTMFTLPIEFPVVQVSKDGMEQSTREVMLHSFLPARSTYLRFACVDRSVNEYKLYHFFLYHILIYVVFKNTVLLLHCSV